MIQEQTRKEKNLEKEFLNNLPFNKLQHSLTLNLGNNTWNVGLFLGLTPLFNEEFAEKYQNIKKIVILMVYRDLIFKEFFVRENKINKLTEKCKQR